VAEAGQRSCTRGLHTRPALLPADDDERRPMIGDERVQDADRRDREDEQRPGHVRLPQRRFGPQIGFEQAR
jgi:hypothetical protein